MTPDNTGAKLILIVGMSASIHLARWVATIRHSSYKLVVFPVMRARPCPELEPYRLIRSRQDAISLPEGEVGVFDLDSVPRGVAETIDSINDYRLLPHPAVTDRSSLTTVHELTKCVRVLQPDLLHSMEVQFAGYLALEAKRRIGRENFPPWLLSNWGSDVLLFRKLQNHLPMLRRVFEEIDGYWAECARDVAIARDFDCKAMFFDPLPASGGISMKRARVSRPSERRLLLVKGYHGWTGRGLAILSAIYMATPELRHLTIRMIFANEAAQETMREIKSRTGLDIAPEPFLERHVDALDRLSEARMVVGVGISDGISTTLLEAMSVGAFPILANTSCACEWIDSGRHGVIVNPHDTSEIAAALVLAAKDDKLVDDAAVRNRAEVARRWSAARNGKKILSNYAKLMDRAKAAAIHAGAA